MKIKVLEKEYPLLNSFLIVWAVLTIVILLIRYSPYAVFWLLLGEQPQF